MSERFYYNEFCEEIFDEETQTFPTNQSICGILNQQQQRIAELEDRWQKLKECVDKELQKDIKRSDLKHESFVICEQFVLDKMQELENGEKR